MENNTDIFKKDEPEMLMCIRVEQLKALYGSVRGNCTKCKSAVWVSVSGQKALQTSSKLKVFCMECAMQEIENDTSGEKPKFRAVPGAMQELLRYLSKAGDN